MNKKPFERYLDKDEHSPHPQEHIHHTLRERTGMSLDTLKRTLADNLYYILGKDKDWATTPHDYFMTLAYTVRNCPPLAQN